MEEISMESKIDHYVVLDNEAKDVKRQMDEIRSDIISYVENEKGDEKSILLEGSTGKIMVSFAESLSVNTKSKDFEDVEVAFDNGDIGELFNKVVTMSIPPSKVDAVMATLKEEGLDDIVTVTTKWGVVKKEFDNYRKTKFADIDNDELQCKVKDVVNIAITPRLQVK